MAQKSRELSQFSSFLEVDNSNKNIGITTTATPYIGIGTTNPTVKLTVIGDTNISGVVSATGYYLNGNSLVSAVVQTWELSGSDIYRQNGNVGIGSTIPTEKLDVIGNIKATGTITGSNINANGITISSGIITASQFISTVAQGTSPLNVTSNTLVTNLNADFLRGKTPPSGDIVGTTDNQTLTNKSLTSPIITSPTVSSAGIAFSGSTSGSTLLQPSAVASGTLTLPAATDTLVTRNTTETLTNKTINVSSNTITGITSSNLSASAGILNTQLANSTISGVSLGSTLTNLTAGTYVSYNSGSTYNGSIARTITIKASSTNADPVNFPIVARDASGNFTAGTISASLFDSTLSGYRVNNTTVIDSSRNLSNISSIDLNGPYNQTIVAVGAANIDCSLGNYFTKTVSTNTTFTVSSVPSSRVYSFTLEVNHTSGNITWFSGVEWPGGTAPSLTTSKTHLFMFVTDDGGTRWRGSSLVNYTT